MAEWTREGIAELISAYKVQENLYNPKNRLYFNKTARVNSLRKITANISKIRPNTKDQEVSKKIQTLSEY